MNRRFFYCVLSLLAFAAGCIPERVLWSPDGTRALVLADNGVYLCDVSGKLTGPVAPHAERAVWLPDGKRFAESSMSTLSTEAQLTAAFPADVQIARKNLDAVHAQLLTVKTGWGLFLSSTEDQLHLTQEQLEMAVMILREHEGAGLLEKIDPSMKHDVETIGIDQHSVQIFSFDDSPTASAGPVLFESPGKDTGVDGLRASPTGDTIAISVKSPNDNEPDKLLLSPTSGHGDPLDFGYAANDPDFTKDGKYLLYIRPVSWNKGDTTVPGVLSRRQIAYDDGKLLTSDKLSSPVDLVGLLFDNWSRVRVAADGRIFFSGAEFSLPAAVTDVDTQPTIFYFDPGRAATLTRVIPRSVAGTMGDLAQYFELSPDARYLSVPFKDGRVSVLDIATGEAAILQPIGEGKQNDTNLKSVPVWRTPTELTFFRPSPDAKRHEIVRYTMTDKSTALLSAGWPEGTMGDLDKPLEPVTQPSDNK